MVCLRYIIVNTLHKGDNDNNNNNKALRNVYFPTHSKYSVLQTKKITNAHYI